MSVLEAVQPKLGEKFVDIGSGTGKAVLLAAALHPLRSCVGIEIVEPLHAVAVRAKEAFFQKLRELSQQGSSKREAGSTAAHDSEASCQLILGDCFDHTANEPRQYMKPNNHWASHSVASRDRPTGVAIRCYGH